MTQLNEVMSFAGFTDVDELRALYYGRLDLYVSFTDDWKYLTSGRDSGGRLSKPAGIIAHTIDTIVGKKAGTHMFYGRVFRMRSSGRAFINDVRQYSGTRYTEDKELLSSLGFFTEEEIERVIQEVEENSVLKSDFARIWEITKRLSMTKGQQLADKYWREVFVGLGYDAFNDPSGTGIIGDPHVPVLLLLNYDKKRDLDIVHVQKYRVDKRKMVTDRVARENHKMRLHRDRIAKMKKEDYHKNKNQSGFMKGIKDLFALAVGSNV